MTGEDKKNGAVTKAKVAFFMACPGGPGGGGAELVTIMIANEFARKGIDVDLVLVGCPRFDGQQQ